MMRGIIFDFNGTLFRDSWMHEAMWIKFAEQLIGRPLSEAEARQMHGRNNHENIEWLLGKSLDWAEAEAIAEEKEGMYRDLVLSDPAYQVLIPGAVDFFNYLKDQGIVYNIATASGKGNVDFYFDSLGIGQWFNRDQVIYNDGTLEGKPSPQPFLLASEVLGLEPAEVLVFEDSAAGIQSAKNAKVQAVIAIVTEGNHQALEAAGADLIIEDFEDPTLYSYIKPLLPTD